MIPFRSSFAMAATCAAVLLPLSVQAQSPSSITIGLNADIRSTNPGVNRDGWTDGVMSHIIEGMVGYREDGTVAPMLAEKVEVSDDGLTYTFSLRKGVKFHNGDTLTAADVLWSWERYMAAETDWRCRSEFDGRNGLKVESVTAPNDHTVVMKINQRSALFLDSMARADCGQTAVLNKASVKADGSWDQPIGTGPYTLKEWRRGQFVDIAAFKDYAALPGERDGYVGAKKALIENVRFLVVPDSSTAKAGLESGALDVSNILASDVAELSKNPRLTVQMPAESSKNVVLIQTRDPVLQNPKLRQAIAAAMDFNQVVQVASEGHAKPNNSAVSSTSGYYTDAQKQGWTYNAERARQLLKESGYKGEKIVLLANKRTHVPSYPVAVITQAMLASIGLNIELQVMEWATQLDRYNSGNYQMMSFTYSARMDPALSYEQFAGDKDKQPRKVWDNPQALEWLAETFVESDQPKRQALFDKLHAQMLEDVPMLMLYNSVTLLGVNKRVQNYDSFVGNPRAWGASLAQ